MKKIAFIGHSYHLKTGSADFFLKLLEKEFLVETYYDQSWLSNKEKLDLKHLDQSYFAVIFWQNMSFELLKQIKCSHLVYVPMYDYCFEFSNYFWYKLRNFKIINFSALLDQKLQNIGLNTLKVQYFPKLAIKSKHKKKTVFFWQRTKEISWVQVKKLLVGNFWEGVHIHCAVDPKHKFLKPSLEDERDFKITYSDWFLNKEEYLKAMETKGIYIAPRCYEGIGMSFLEAMAMGKAVVASNRPTMNEYITHGVNGYLFEPFKPCRIDFSELETVQNNAYEYIKNGQALWQKSQHEILEFCLSKKKEHVFFSENPLAKYYGFKIKRVIKQVVLKLIK